MAETKLPMYKDKPLVRSGNTLYYGDPSEPCVAMLQIVSSKPGREGKMIADKVLVQLLSTNETLRPQDRILKRAEKPGLYEALAIASIWLDRTLPGGPESAN